MGAAAKVIVWHVMEEHDVLGASLDYDVAKAFADLEASSLVSVVDRELRQAEADVVLARYPINAIEVLHERDKRRRAREVEAARVQ